MRFYLCQSLPFWEEAQVRPEGFAFRERTVPFGESNPGIGTFLMKAIWSLMPTFHGYYTKELHLKPLTKRFWKKKDVETRRYTDKKRLSCKKMTISCLIGTLLDVQLYSYIVADINIVCSNSQINSPLSWLSAIGFHFRNMGYSVLGSEDLDLSEHALLLNGIYFFRHELKMSGQSEQLPCYRDLEPSFVWWAPVGLCYLSTVVSWLGMFCTETGMVGYDRRWTWHA